MCCSRPCTVCCNKAWTRRKNPRNFRTRNCRPETSLVNRHVFQWVNMNAKKHGFIQTTEPTKSLRAHTFAQHNLKCLMAKHGTFDSPGSCLRALCSRLDATDGRHVFKSSFVPAPVRARRFLSEPDLRLLLRWNIWISRPYQVNADLKQERNECLYLQDLRGFFHQHIVILKNNKNIARHYLLTFFPWVSCRGLKTSMSVWHSFEYNLDQ